jgi:hypothetical protein
MPRVLFSPHAIRTAEEHHMASPIKQLLQEECGQGPNSLESKNCVLTAEPYFPVRQMRHPGGQGGPSSIILAEDVISNDKSQSKTANRIPACRPFADDTVCPSDNLPRVTSPPHLQSHIFDATPHVLPKPKS